MTSPDSGPCQCASTASAIAALAFPAPTTIVRPLGGAGRKAGTRFRGSAAATAASKSPHRIGAGSVDVGMLYMNGEPGLETGTRLRWQGVIRYLAGGSYAGYEDY